MNSEQFEVLRSVLQRRAAKEEADGKVQARNASFLRAFGMHDDARHHAGNAMDAFNKASAMRRTANEVSPMLRKGWRERPASIAGIQVTKPEWKRRSRG